MQSQATLFTSDALTKALKNIILTIADKDIQTSLLKILGKNDFNLLLRNAVNQKQIGLVTFLLTSVPTVNVNSRGATSGQTSLHIACINGCLPIVKLLIDHGAFVNAVDHQGLCPAILAQMHDHFDVMNHLLSCGGMRYLTSHDANITITLQGRPEEQKREIIKAVNKLNQCDDELIQRPSIAKTFLCAYILKNKSATLMNLQACNNSKKEHQIENAEIPLLAFLRRHRIPLLTRNKLLTLNNTHKDLPLDAMTALLATELVNEESVVLPYPVECFNSINELVDIFTTENSSEQQQIAIHVYQNNAAITIDKAPLLRWELCIPQETLTNEQISNLAKKINAEIITEAGQKKLTFLKIDKDVVAELKATLELAAAKHINSDNIRPQFN